jgi:hypothetical protein
MPRVMSTAMLNALTSSEMFPALFLQAGFATGPVYLWSGFGSITWGGRAWLGIGTLGSISMIEEGTAVEAKGIALKLSGIDTTLLGDVLGEFHLGLPVIVYLGAFAPGGPSSLIANPIPIWTGRMDQPTLDISGTTSSISIACESRFIDMNVAVDRRYTNDDQQRDWPGDLGFMFVQAIQEMTLYWGTSPTSTNNI